MPKTHKCRNCAFKCASDAAFREHIRDCRSAKEQPSHVDPTSDAAAAPPAVPTAPAEEDSDFSTWCASVGIDRKLEALLREMGADCASYAMQVTADDIPSDKPPFVKRALLAAVSASSATERSRSRRTASWRRS